MSQSSKNFGMRNGRSRAFPLFSDTAGAATHTAIIALLLVVVGGFMIVKFYQVDKELDSLKKEARLLLQRGGHKTSPKLKNIQQTAQKTERRLNRSLDGYRAKLLELDKNNKNVLREWKKEFSGLMKDIRERASLKEQELDQTIALYQLGLENLIPAMPPN